MTNQSDTVSYWSVKSYESYGNKYTLEEYESACKIYRVYRKGTSEILIS